MNWSSLTSAASSAASNVGPGSSGSSSSPPVAAPKDYKYVDYIRTPDAMGASSAGNLDALSKDVTAMLGYVDVLVSGKGGKGSAQTVAPLGNKYFMDTNAECTATGAKHPRYAFINNIPDGKIPMLPGTNKDFRGLVPGMLEGLGYMNPANLFKAFSTDDTCQRVTMDVRDENNQESTDSRYVLDSDLKEYNPCWFTNRRNPISNAKCEGFKNSSQLPKDLIVQVYALGIGLLATYLIYRVVQKKN